VDEDFGPFFTLLLVQAYLIRCPEPVHHLRTRWRIGLMKENTEYLELLIIVSKTKFQEDQENFLFFSNNSKNNKFSVISLEFFFSQTIIKK